VLDAISFEKRGVPAAAVITEPFLPTAEAMARMAGMPGYPVAVVPHPIGPLGPAEVVARADAIAARVEALLLEAPGPTPRVVREREDPLAGGQR
jgi:hypothetical protein